MKKLNSKGFSAIEGVLIVITAGIIGGVSWFVWHSKNSISNTYDNAAKNQAVTPVKTKPECKTTNSNIACLTYGQARQITFTVPDGWNVLDVFWKGATQNLIVLRNNDVYTPGQKATIRNSEGGWDGWSTFDAEVNDASKDKNGTPTCDFIGSYNSKESFNTSNFRGTKYVQIVTKDEMGYVDSQQKGSYYYYSFPYTSKNKNLCLDFTYAQFANQPDQLAAVEAAIKTAAKY